MKNIPFLYRYLHAKMREHSSRGKMKTWEFREMLCQIMRIKKNYSLIVLKELEDMKLVKYERQNEIIRVL